MSFPYVDKAHLSNPRRESKKNWRKFWTNKVLLYIVFPYNHY